MSLAFKIASLGVRTLAKPIGNYIKHQASEHEGFRAVCVAFAQRLHRIDMRMRLGLLQDPRVIEQQVRREADEAERKKNPAQKATAKTKEEADAHERERDEIRRKLKRRRPIIKPLSEAKAIDSGATFLSEGFLFLVAGALILLEQWRAKRKDSARRDEVADRLDALELQLDGLRAENQTLREGGVLTHERVDGAVGAPVLAQSVTPPSKPAPAPALAPAKPPAAASGTTATHDTAREQSAAPPSEPADRAPEQSKA